MRPEIEYLVTDCDWLADVLCPDPPRGDHDPFWYDSGRLLAHKSAWKELARSLQDSPFEFISDRLRNHLDEPEKTAGSIRAIIRTATAFLETRGVAACLSSTHCDLADFTKRAMSIFLVIPSDLVRTNAGFIRVVTACLLAAAKRTSPRERTVEALLLLDEFANMGKLSQIETDLTLVRAYGLHLFLVLQNLNQLKAEYGETRANGIISQCHFQLFMASGDSFTNEYVSKRLGISSAEYKSISHSHGSGGSSTSTSYSVQARDLQNPDEVARLDDDRVYLVTKGAQPEVLRRIRYYQDSLFADKAEPNPFYLG